MHKPKASEWFILLSTYVLGSVVCVLMAMLAMNSSGSSFIAMWGDDFAYLSVGVTGLLGLVHLFQRKLALAVVLNLGQVVAVQVALWSLFIIIERL